MLSKLDYWRRLKLMTEKKHIKDKNNYRGRVRARVEAVRKFFTPGRLRLILSVLCLVTIAITTWMAWPSFYQTEKHSIDGAIDYLPYRLNEGDVLTQPFIPTQDGLSSFYLSFDLAHDWERPEEAQLILEFFDLELEAQDSELMDRSSDSIAKREPVYALAISGSPGTAGLPRAVLPPPIPATNTSPEEMNHSKTPHAP